MTSRLKILLSTLSLAIVYALYYFALPAALNTAAKTSVVRNILKSESGFDFELLNPKFKVGFLPYLYFKADKLSFAADNAHSPLVVEEPALKTEIFPLIFKKAYIHAFKCKSIYADVKIDEKNRIYIGDNLIMQLSDSKLNVENAKVNIQTYNINLKDEKFKKKLKINGNYLIVDKFNSNNIDFATDTKIISNGKAASVNVKVKAVFPSNKNVNPDDFDIDGTVINLDLSEISPYISLLTDGKIQQLRGVLNADTSTSVVAKSKKNVSNIVFNNASVICKNASDNLIFPEKFSVHSEISLEKNNLNIEKCDFKAKDFNFNVSGKIENMSSKKPVLDINLSIFPSRSEILISMIPVIQIPNSEIDLEAVKKYGLYSWVEGKLNIKGSALKPFINGTVTISDTYINKPLDIPRAIIKLNFNKDRLYADADVPVNPPEKVFVKCDINLYNPKDVTLNITSTKNVNLKLAQIVLLPLHEMIRFPLGPVPVMDVMGYGNIKLKTKGDKTDPHLFGAFNFNNGTVSFNDINCLLENGQGKLLFEDTIMYFSTDKAFVKSKPVKITGKCNVDGDLDFDVVSPEINLNTLLIMLKTSPMLSDFSSSVKYLNGTSGNAAFNLNLRGRAKDMSEFILGKTVNASGNIKLLGNDVLIGKLRGGIKNIKGNINFKNTDIFFDLYPLMQSKRLKVKGKIQGEKIYTKINLGGISQVYNDIPIKILSGNIEVTGDKVYLRKINGVMDTKPFFVDGTVDNIINNPEISLYLHSKVNQNFIDNYLNKNQIYPLITKGDINYAVRANGSLNDINVKALLKLDKEASLYYLGAVIGDAKNPINISLDCNLKNKILNIKNLQYDKLITSQNNRSFSTPQLNVKGVIDLSKPDFKAENLRIRTFVPTDARIFNLMFKKNLIKQGMFESNMLINGNSSNFKILGKLDFNNIYVPFFEMTLHDINLLFKEKFIDFKARGDVFSQGFKLSGSMYNQFTCPIVVEDADFILKKLDINQLTGRINNFEIQSNMSKIAKDTEPANNFDLKNLIIKKMSVKADSIRLRNITANNLSAHLSVKDNGVININKFNFYLAEGSVNGAFKYNTNDGATKLDLVLNNVNANGLTEALLNLSNQLYGSLSGELNISCKGHTYNEWMKSLNGNGGFRVTNGKMPKLGSLEYLLKAANLVKSGITGLTLNSLIDLVTPLKTGEFETINGAFTLKSGKAEDVQIFSKGKNLSIFITGEYECISSFADLQIFGRVSKKISNALGIVGNTSLNTLFNTIPGINLDSENKASFIKSINKIPGIELNDKTYRIFNASIHGELNSDNYVQSFQWVE